MSCKVRLVALLAVATMLLTALSAPAMAQTFVTPVNDGFANDGFVDNGFFSVPVFFEPFFFAGPGVVGSF